MDIIKAKTKMDDCVAQYIHAVTNNPDSIEALSLRSYYVERAAETYIEDLSDLIETFGETDKIMYELARANQIYGLVTRTKESVLTAYRELASISLHQ